jgi:hypothetical protein
MKREHNKSIKEFAAQLEKLHKDLSKARDAALSQLADESLKNEPGHKPDEMSSGISAFKSKWKGAKPKGCPPRSRK